MMNTVVAKTAERYVPQYKQKVLDFLKPSETSSKVQSSKVTILEASKKFLVHPVTISDWLKDVARQKEIEILQEKHSSSSRNVDDCTSSKVREIYEKVETEIVQWLVDRRDCNLQSHQIANKILSVIHDNYQEFLQDYPSKIKLSWLTLWAQKLLKSPNETTGGEVLDTPELRSLGINANCELKLNSRIQYTVPFKTEIVQYAKKMGQRRASRLFCISQKRVCEWMKLYNSPSTQSPTSNESQSKTETPKLLAAVVTDMTKEDDDAGDETFLPPPCKRPHLNLDEGGEVVNKPSCTKPISSKCSKQVLDINVEKEVFKWMQSQLASNMRPSSTEIRNKAVEMYRSKGFNTIKCSYGWYRRWEKRFKVGATSHENDPVLLSWLLEQYDNNNIITYSDLRSYAKESLRGLKSTFKASPGWAARFFKRNHVLINWDGYNEEDLPQNLQDKVDNFLSNVVKINLTTDFGPAQIGCMDEIPLSFTSSAFNDTDISESGQISRLRKVSVKNCQATVLLSLRADGYLHPPMVVVKGQNTSNLNQVYSINDNPVVVFYGKSTEPTIPALNKWLELIWLKHSQQPSLLFTDSYDLHLRMRTSCSESEVRHEIFPSGCSCKLQPINVYARKTFQKLIENNWEEYLKKNEPKIKLPSTNEMITWIHDAYMTMKLENHQKKLFESFKTVFGSHWPFSVGPIKP